MQKQKDLPQIQLELPDYSQMYYKWKKKQDEKETKEENVVIIDIY